MLDRETIAAHLLSLPASLGIRQQLCFHDPYPGAMQKYKVRPGDTLGSIALRCYGDRTRFPLIVAANSIKDPDRLKVGQELVIPDLDAAGRAFVPPPPPPAPVTPATSGVAALSERRLGQVHPIVGSRGRAMIELCAHAGFPILVTQGLRTWEEQDALYARGRTEPPIGKQYVVTKAKGGESYHNFGLAFDIVVLDAIGKADWNSAHPGWGAAANAGKSVGLEWGGDWKTFKDLPHFQYVGGVGLAACRAAFPGGLEAVWEKVT